MTNQQLLAAHAYSEADRQELMSAIALFQLSGLPFTPKGAYQMVRGTEPPPLALWFKSWKLPLGFRVFNITPSDRAERFANVIQHRSMAFDWQFPRNDATDWVVGSKPHYWVVRLSDYYRLLEVQAEQPELELPLGVDCSTTKPAEPVTWSHATLRLRFTA